MTSEGFFLCKKGTPEVAFELRKFEVQELEDNQVLVETEAFGLNYADVMARRGLYREAPDFPCIIGYEVVGKVVSCGKNVDKNLIGKRVMAFCRFGGYAKHVMTTDIALQEVENQPAEELLALCTQGVTAYYMAFYLAPIHSTDIVLVHAAAGGVGTLLVQLAKLKGAKVIAKVGRAEKESLVKDLGADFVVNYRTKDYVESIVEHLGEERIDLSFNPVAGSTFKQDMSILGAGGRMVLFGGSQLSNSKWGILSQLNFVRKMGLVLPIGLMMRSKNVLGVNMLKIADDKPMVLKHCLTEIYKLYQTGQIKPQSGGSYAANQLNEAHTALENGSTTGKLIVNW